MDAFEDVQALDDDVKVRLLLKRPLSHLKHVVDLLLIVSYILHRLELLLKRVEISIELLCLGTNRAATGATRGRRHDRI